MKFFKHLFPSHKPESHYGYEVRAGQYVESEVFHETEDFLNYVDQQSQEVERRGVTDKIGLLKTAPSGEYLFAMIFDLPARGDLDSQLADFYTKKKLPYDTDIFNKMNQLHAKMADSSSPVDQDEAHEDEVAVTAENDDFVVAPDSSIDPAPSSIDPAPSTVSQTPDVQVTEQQVVEQAPVPTPEQQAPAPTPEQQAPAPTPEEVVEQPVVVDPKDLEIQRLKALLLQEQKATVAPEPEVAPTVNPALEALQEDVSSSVVTVLEEKQGRLSTLLNESDHSGTIRREVQEEFDQKRVTLLAQVQKAAAHDLEEAKQREQQRYEQALRELDEQFDKTQAHLVVEVEQSVQQEHDLTLQKRLEENQKQLEQLLSAREDLTKKINQAKQLFA
ncbi:hypothetical protein [Fructobacillus tropaeoli]|uniref:Protein TTN-1, isoform g n=1 Tax=Fructobacillus tropaeoli TaxID=709323 RepID=A0A3F3HDP6_9LACO|nr:hypothetical protein [Fructobacillus tropaeoli]GAP04980.1 protein TTN-1, isoform g [Fructobacillus tropaeoli]